MIIKNALIFGEDFTFFQGDVKVEEGKITEIGSLIADGETVDANGLYLLPGFIDIHTHGCAGADFCDAGIDTMLKMADQQAQNGVTSFLPTSMTVSTEMLENVFATLKTYMEQPHDGAHVYGAYMEGPFFSAAHKGAQPEAYLQNPNATLFHRLNRISGNAIRVVALAPELTGSSEFIREVKKTARVSIGHTAASYDTVMHAFADGASNMTHLYNAMTELSHRDPGAVGAAFDSDATVELICDGIHIHPAVIRATFKEVGARRIVLISDSMRASGMPDGRYSLGGQEVYVTGGVAKLADGTIAGSVTNVRQCVRNIVKFGISLEDALMSATINPARVAGIDHVTGSISPGKYADLLLTDRELNLRQVFVRGRNQLKHSL